MIKLLIGGSPCTFWSIAQKNGRETEAEGMGWELFKNYLIAKEKFKPDFFLYENNKSAAQPIKDQISRELGVDLMYINSALVSAQNRQRFYAFNWEVERPEDRGIVLKDILEQVDMISEPLVPFVEKKLDKAVEKFGYLPETWNPYNNAEITEKAPTQTAQCGSQTKSATVMVCEPVRVGSLPRPNGELSTSQAKRIYSIDGKSVNLVANGGGEGAKTGLYAVPYELSTEYYKGGEDGGLIGMTANGEGKYRNGKQPSQQYRVYSCEDKSQVVNTLGNENYIVPMRVPEATKRGCVEIQAGDCVDLTMPNSKTRRGRSMKEKSNCLTTASQEFYQYCGTIDKPIYEVKDGFITIKGKQYPIKIKDGYYIIRKLTPIECERLQTLPDNYTSAVSNTQRYKGLGNGWTAEVIIHILNGALKDVPRDEEIVVLSMYDGIGTGRYCLDKMGFTNVKYFAYEIDKYAKQVAMSNYPDIIQMGDAFDLRHPDWTIGY